MLCPKSQLVAIRNCGEDLDSGMFQRRVDMSKCDNSQEMVVFYQCSLVLSLFHSKMCQNPDPVTLPQEDSSVGIRKWR